MFGLIVSNVIIWGSFCMSSVLNLYGLGIHIIIIILAIILQLTIYSISL